MELVTVNNGSPVTTTLAIADGTENEHASLMLLVRKYQSDLAEFGLVDFKSKSSGGRPTEYAELNEQQSTLILTYMRNSDIVRTFKKRLVKAFYELAHRSMVPQSLPEALRLAADLAEQNALLAPKAAVADRLTNADGWFSLRNAAKALKIKEHEFIKWMQINNWIFRNKRGTLEGYAAKVPRYLDHKITPIPSDGNEDRVNLQVMVTAEGLTKLARIFNVELNGIREAA